MVALADTFDAMRACPGPSGDIVFVELVQVGTSVSKGEPFGVVESVKVRLGDSECRRTRLKRPMSIGCWTGSQQRC